MSHIVPRKGKAYRISGLLIIEPNGAFIYPADVYSTAYDYSNRIRLDNSAFFILDVDCLIDDSVIAKDHEYIRGVVQGYNGMCYLSSYNISWLRDL